MQEVISKSEFAARIKVTPGRISQYISAGIIGPDALVGEGRLARVDVAKALRQIGMRRHVGQSLGNGLGTRLALEPDDDDPSPEMSGPDNARKKDVAELIQLERLEQERRKNRQQAIDEAAANGNLVTAEALEREVGKATQAVVSAFNGMAPDLANAISAKFELSQRDVLHLVRQVMNDRRKMIAAAAREEAEALPETEEIIVG